MNENLTQNQLSETEQPGKPVHADNEAITDNLTENKVSEKEVQTQEGQSSDPSNLILGKFKSVEDLSNAYKELEKFQGIQSEELGNLRQNSVLLNNIQNAWQKENAIRDGADILKEAAKKYNQPEYFQDPSFRELYREAFLALGKNLDTDRFINLIEGYVSSRLFAREKMQAANNETEKDIESINFEKNNTSSLVPPKKKLHEMTDQELNELLEKFI